MCDPYLNVFGPPQTTWKQFHSDPNCTIAEFTNEDNFNRLWHRHFGQQYKKLTGKSWQGAKVDDDVANLIAHAMSFKAWDERSGILSRSASSRMTGEWIIYVEEAGRRVYLTLALHSEPTSMIVARLRQLAEEFPFVVERLDKAANNLVFVAP